MAVPAANRLETPSRFLMAVMWEADGRIADADAARDRGVREALGHQLQHQPLCRRQLVPSWCGVA